MASPKALSFDKASTEDSRTVSIASPRGTMASPRLEGVSSMRVRHTTAPMRGKSGAFEDKDRDEEDQGTPREDRGKHISAFRKAILLKNFNAQVTEKERMFLRKIQEDDRYHALEQCTHGCKDYRVELSRIIWDVVGPEQEQLITLQDRNKFLEERSVKQQKQFLMEMTSMRAKMSKHDEYELDESTCMYEPLMHLDADHRELVLEISKIEINKIIEGKSSGGTAKWLFEQLQRVDSMSEELCNLKKEAKELKKQAGEYPVLKDLVKNLTSKCEDLTKKHGEALFQVDEGKRREGKLQDELRQAQAKPAAVAPADDSEAKKQLRELRLKMEQDEKKSQSVVEQLEKVEKQLEVEKKRFAEMKAKFEDAQSNLKNASSNKDNDAAAAADLRRKSDAAMALSEQHARMIEQLQAELVEAKNASRGIVEEAEKKVKKLEEELQRLRKGIQQARRASSSSSFEVEELRRQMTEMEEQLKDADVTLKKEVKARQKLEQVNADLQKELDEMRLKYQTSELALAELGERLQAMTEALESKGVKKEVLQQAMEDSGLAGLATLGPSKNRVFDRLYRDAAERVARLEKKRVELQKLRSEALLRDQNMLFNFKDVLQAPMTQEKVNLDPMQQGSEVNFTRSPKGPVVVLKQSPKEKKAVAETMQFIAESFDNIAEDGFTFGPSLGGAVVKSPSTKKALTSQSPLTITSDSRTRSRSPDAAKVAQDSRTRSRSPPSSGRIPAAQTFSFNATQAAMEVVVAQSFSPEVSQRSPERHIHVHPPSRSQRSPSPTGGPVPPVPPVPPDFSNVPLHIGAPLDAVADESQSHGISGGMISHQSHRHGAEKQKQAVNFGPTKRLPQAASTVGVVSFPEVSLHGVHIDKIGEQTHGSHNRDHSPDIQARTLPGPRRPEYHLTGQEEGTKAPPGPILQVAGQKSFGQTAGPIAQGATMVETYVPTDPSSALAVSSQKAAGGQQKSAKPLGATHQPNWRSQAEKAGWEKGGGEAMSLAQCVERSAPDPPAWQQLEQHIHKHEAAANRLPNRHEVSNSRGTDRNRDAIASNRTPAQPHSMPPETRATASSSKDTAASEAPAPWTLDATQGADAPSWYNFCRGEESAEAEYYRRRMDNPPSVRGHAPPALSQSTSLPSLSQSPTRGPAGQGGGRGRGRGQSGQRFQQLWVVD